MRIWTIFAIATVVVACDEKPAEVQPSSEVPAPVEQPATVEAVPAEPEVLDEEIPTREDFEEEAERTITSENLPEQLDAIEYEIEAG